VVKELQVFINSIKWLWEPKHSLFTDMEKISWMDLDPKE
jgi:hypothetical protein